jgi:hypothetical protein
MLHTVEWSPFLVSAITKLAKNPAIQRALQLNLKFKINFPTRLWAQSGKARSRLRAMQHIARSIDTLLRISLRKRNKIRKYFLMITSDPMVIGISYLVSNFIRITLYSPSTVQRSRIGNGCKSRIKLRKSKLADKERK